MIQDLQQMTNTELKQYISKYRNDGEAFRAALEILMSRRDPNLPYPFDLNDPESEVEAILMEKIEQIE